MQKFKNNKAQDIVNGLITHVYNIGWNGKIIKHKILSYTTFKKVILMDIENVGIRMFRSNSYISERDYINNSLYFTNPEAALNHSLNEIKNERNKANKELVRYSQILQHYDKIEQLMYSESNSNEELINVFNLEVLELKRKIYAIK